MSRILISGSSGLIGSWLCKKLIAEGHEVHGFSRTDRNHTDGVIPHLFDLRDQERAEREILAIKPEIVFHLAADARENASLFSPTEIVTSGINTFLNVLVPSINAGHLQKFNFTSSIAVYGPITIPFREQDMPLPQDIYGITKLAIEQMIRKMADVHKFKYTIFRPHNVYGPGQNMSDPYRNVVTLFMNQLLKGEPYTIYGDGSMKRCFSYVKDVVDVIARGGMDKKTGLTLNVGSDDFYTLQELSDLIQDIAQIRIQPKYLPTRIHEVQIAVSDHTIADTLYPYEKTTFVSGLMDTWEYCKAQGPQNYQFRKFEINNEKVIPQNWRTK